MNEYIIREGNIEDIKDLQILRKELILNDEKMTSKELMIDLNWAISQDGYDDFKSNLDNSDEYIYVISTNKEIVGYMTCWVNDQEKWDKYKTFEIGNLYIKREHRHKGLGSLLVNKAKEICKEKNISFLKINVLYDNLAARKFYQKNGLYSYAVEQFIELK